MKKLLYLIPILLILLLAWGASGQLRQRLSPAPLDATPRLVILSAFDPELGKLRAQLQGTQVYEVNGRSFFTGRLAGQDVVLALSGVSMVNAAMTAQAALDRFNARGLLFSGIAGGVNPDLSIGDVTVPAQWGEYQEQMAARQAGDGWDTGSYSRDLGNFGMMFPQKVSVTHKSGRVDAEEQRFWFPADPRMLAAAKDAAGQVKLGKCTLLNVCLQGDPRVVTGGNGVSGPTFVDNAEYRQWVWQTFHADALDMELAAVAHVAYTNAVPFIAFRSLSDLAGGGSGQNEMLTFFQLAADNSAGVVVKFLEIYQP